MKATAIAHPIQGLIKYHGLRNARLRLPFHDSISVCAKALYSKTTVEFDGSLKEDRIIINKKNSSGQELERCLAVVDPMRRLARSRQRVRVESINNLTEGKGLGFSASGFAALGKAASESLGLKISEKQLCTIVRLGAGSATRSLAGSFSIWYANRRGESYAEQLASEDAVNLGMAVIPIASTIRTDIAHEESVRSPLFRARLNYLRVALVAMRKAIRQAHVARIGELAEIDTLNLHAVTMTGRSGMILLSPESLRIIAKIHELRERGIPAWYSLDTGPSVFVNTERQRLGEIVHELESVHHGEIITSDIGSGATIVEDHLF